MRISLYLFIAGFLAISCTDELDPDKLNLEPSRPQLVVEGWVYDTITSYSRSYVFLSLSSSFVDNEGPTPINTNDIQFVRFVEEGSGITTELQKSPDDKFYWYPTDTTFRGTIGKTYRLELSYRQDLYTATSTINRNAELDALSTEYRGPDHPEVFDPIEDTGYYFKFNGPEPCEPGDFYRFKSYLNGKQYNRPGDLIFTDDESVNGNYIGEFSFPTDPYHFGDTAHFEMLSIDEKAFNFYSDAINMIFNGGLFAQPHFNVPTNIVTPPNAPDALGLFGAASIVSESVIFTKELKPNYKGLIGGRKGKAWGTPVVQDTTFLFKPDGTLELKSIAPFSTKCRDQVRNAPTAGTGSWAINEEGTIMTLTYPVLGTVVTIPFKINALNGVAMDLQDPNNPNNRLVFLVNSGAFQ